MKSFNPKSYTSLMLADQEYQHLKNGDNPFSMGVDPIDRTSSQRRAKWLYMTMVANELTNRGEQFYISATKTNIPYTKDLLNDVYWETARGLLFKDKRTLGKAEYSKMSEHIMDMFAMLWGVSLPWPDVKRIKEEYK